MSGPPGACAGPAMTMTHVIVWRIPLDPDSPPDAAAVAELSNEERARAARFATDALRNRWLHGHVALRRMLARELDVPPGNIAYRLTEHGKPYLDGALAGRLEFSYSDSGDLALLAVGALGPVGVDVEAFRPVPELVAVAKRFFTPTEYEELLTLDSDRRTDAFYRIWTRKEALIKAIGSGLAFGLHRFEVTGGPEPRRVVSITDDGDGSMRWSCADLAMPPGYQGAVAAAGTECEVEVRDYGR